MKTMRQQGFATAEGLLVVVVLLILGFTGWFVWHSQKDASKTLNTTNTQTGAANKTSPYAGWKTFTSTAEKFSIRYPANWTEDNWSVTDCANGPDQQCVESYDFIAPNGLRVRYNQLVDTTKADDRIGCGTQSACEDQKVLSIDALNVPNYGPVDLVKTAMDAYDYPDNCFGMYLHLPAGAQTTPVVGSNQYTDHMIQFSLPSTSRDGRYMLWLTNTKAGNGSFDCHKISQTNFFSSPTVVEAQKVLESLHY
ncbi:MAG TPA: hypothetical protein VLF69_02470 [Candidatus Saccharimonadales bacterium]|nr:hypothetical protein [Candidatus Saccharimonadales bacterium]